MTTACWSWLLRPRVVGVTLALMACMACTPPPPTLSPAGVAAYRGTQVIKALDLLRDTAVDLNGQRPPQLSTATARQVITWHRSAITIVHAVPTGWVAAVQAGLEELARDLPAEERPRLTPYLTLARTLLLEVAR